MEYGPAAVGSLRKYLWAWRSVLRGRDGLSPWEQVERNVTIIAGNVIIIVFLVALAVAIRIWRIL